MLFRTILTLGAATLALANPLIPRQTTNTNARIAPVVDTLSTRSRQIMFDINTMQANNTATDGTVGVQVQNYITQFNNANNALKAIPVSSGSTTVQPLNIEISRTFGETLQLISTGLSGLKAQGTVPNFSTMVAQLDPTVAATATQLNTTLPGSLGFVHTLMLDAQQFLVQEGAWPETLAAIGF